jgi:hypothetical protein
MVVEAMTGQAVVRPFRCQLMQIDVTPQTNACLFGPKAQHFD